MLGVRPVETPLEQARVATSSADIGIPQGNHMRIGVYSGPLPELDRRQFFACAERGIRDVELGVGAWGPRPRPYLDLATIGSRSERDRPKGELGEFGLRLAAVNAAGNLLHPDPGKRADAQARFEAALDLAMALGVNRLITMSGCPAGPGGGTLGVFPCWATSSDAGNLFAWQMENEVGPFWQNVSQRLAARSPDLMICLELHPGVTIFTAAGFEALTRYVGRNIGINMDPSSFLVAGHRSVDGDRAARQPHRLCPWQGYAGLPGSRPPRRPLAFCAAGRRSDRAPWHFAPVGEGMVLPPGPSSSALCRPSAMTM